MDHNHTCKRQRHMMATTMGEEGEKPLANLVAYQGMEDKTKLKRAIIRAVFKGVVTYRSNMRPTRVDSSADEKCSHLLAGMSMRQLRGIYNTYHMSSIMVASTGCLKRDWPLFMDNGAPSGAVVTVSETILSFMYRNQPSKREQRTFDKNIHYSLVDGGTGFATAFPWQSLESIMEPMPYLGFFPLMEEGMYIQIGSQEGDGTIVFTVDC